MSACPECAALVEEIARYRASLIAHHEIAHVTDDDLRRYWREGKGCPVCNDAHANGWPTVEIGGPVAHSPVDSYRCENPECPSGYEVWQFRPDDYDLDETAVLCPACGEPGEMFFRRFRFIPEGEGT